jgi:hypothetical protein
MVPKFRFKTLVKFLSINMRVLHILGSTNSMINLKFGCMEMCIR